MDYRVSARMTDPDMGNSPRRAESAMSGGRAELCYGSGGHIAWCCVIFSLAALMVASFQSGFFSVIRPFGIAPDLCLAFVVACGLLFGSRPGAISGIAAGFFIDALTTGGFSVNIILYFLCGAIVGVFKLPEPRPFRDIWRYFASILSACCLKKVIEALWVVLTASSLDASKLYAGLMIRGIVCTVIFSLAVYVPTAAAYTIVRRMTATRKRY